jgi:uncharacterized protein YgiM (DUF1202 family)
MARRGWLGWAVAGVLAVAWLGSDEEKNAAVAPQGTVERSAPKPLEPKPPPQLPSRLEPSVPKKPVAPQYLPERLYAVANVRLRGGPSTSSAVVWNVPRGTEVQTIARDADWHRVKVSTYEGWIRGDLLSSTPPALEQARPSPPPPAAPLVRQTPARRSGEPLRDSYVGTCDCPYDRMRNGRRCGGNSAYSKPGGRNPQCYF